MAGMGPPPNPNARRQNKRTDGFVRLSGARTAPAPELPESDWLEVTVEAWQTWWASPQATQWHDADLPTLYLMAAVYQSAMLGDPKAMTEFRQMADRFGLSPLARLRNRWLVEPESEVEAAAEAVESKIGSVVQLRRKSG